MGQKRQGLRMKVHRHKDKTKEIASLNQQLDMLGLKIVPVTADGNCFFRAIAEQLEGDEEQHAKYRQLVVDYLKEKREEFEPFVEDEVPFDDYCKSMGEDGTWAGHMELQATSLVNRCNICIHQLKTPRWHIRNFDTGDTTIIHLSYHDGEHYNSVRRQDDLGLGPAKPITIEGDAIPPPPMKGDMKEKNKELEAATIKRIMVCSGCTNESRAREVLRDVHGDADAAIEYLIAEGSGEASSNGSYDSDPGSSVTTGDQSGSYRTSMSDEGESTRSAYSNAGSENGATSTTNESAALSQRVGRNKPCPCGSKRKYKACCGTSRTRMTLAYVSRAEETLSNKFRKQKQKITKGLHPTNEEERSRPLTWELSVFDTNPYILLQLSKVSFFSFISCRAS